MRFPNPTHGIEAGEYYLQGHVEIFHNSEWGTICNNHFDNNGADVLCRMMGHASGVYNTSYKQPTVIPSTRIWLDNVRCMGGETNIKRCRHDSWGSGNCSHSQDVAIRCYGIQYSLIVSNAFHLICLFSLICPNSRLTQNRMF